MKISPSAWAIMSISVIIVSLYFYDQHRKAKGQKGILAALTPTPATTAAPAAMQTNGIVLSNSPAALAGAASTPTNATGATLQTTGGGINPTLLASSGTSIAVDNSGNIVPVSAYQVQPLVANTITPISNPVNLSLALPMQSAQQASTPIATTTGTPGTPAPPVVAMQHTKPKFGQTKPQFGQREIPGAVSFDAYNL
jgi:hypothetical protein